MFVVFDKPEWEKRLGSGFLFVDQRIDVFVRQEDEHCDLAVDF